MSAVASACFHCGEPLPTDGGYRYSIDGVERHFCCLGCQTVAASIVDSGMTDFYRYRDGLNPTIDPSKQDSARYLPYDDEALQAEFVTLDPLGAKSATLSSEAIHCAACAWLIERALSQLPEVRQVNVNTAQQRIQLSWQADQPLSPILLKLAALGYEAAPFHPAEEEARFQRQSQQLLIRMGLAGLATMQVMMFAVALYFGAYTGIEPQHENYFRLISLLVALPVIGYAAQPFYINALRGLRARQLNMDLPVSLALLLAFIASSYATLTQQGEVYFESVSMFTFFLLSGRYLELQARKHAAHASANLIKLMPSTALRKQQGQFVSCAARSLDEGDVILIKAGDTVPADAVVVSGSSKIDESMLTGEPEGVDKSAQSLIYAGTINGPSALQATVLRRRDDSVIAQIIHNQHNALSSRPRIARVADQIAKYFVAGLLLIATTTYLVWQWLAPADALWITLSVLVATCPCALSLATPTALAAAITRINRAGMMVKRANLLDALARVTTIVFDKTGTLTRGEIALTQTQILTSQWDEAGALQLAASLEHYSEHPLARAFLSANQSALLPIDSVEVVAGKGVRGTHQGQHVAIGSSSWLLPEHPTAQIVLTVAKQPVAFFSVADPLRTDAKSTLATLAKRPLKLVLATGDQSRHVDQIAEQLPELIIHKGLLPDDKQRLISALQEGGETVLAVGDGINDAPALAQAHCSLAMGGGTDLAKQSADAVIAGNHLGNLLTLLAIGSKTQRVIRQNLLWAAGYNLAVVPLAASGHVPPYLAALGMSLSSLLVLFNSLRLLR